MLLTPEIITILTLDFIFAFFGLIAFVISIKIVKNWNLSSTSAVQYKLEKQSFLVATIIKYIFIVKLPLFLFFIFTADKLSDIITGAMCAAGVVSSASFGSTMFVYKIFNLYLFGFWLVLNHYDIKDEKLPYVRYKFLLYAIGFISLVIEIYYDISFFESLDVSKLVSCCGTIFSTTSTSAISFIYTIKKIYFVYAFYAVFIFGLLVYLLRNAYLIFIFNIFYLIVAIFSLIMIFGTYIYQLPTHHCPFCMLQKNYYYIGYVLYIALYVGTFFGMSGAIMSLIKKKSQNFYYNISLIFIVIYAIIISIYPIVYHIKNGVWL
ncbi:MAG: hypothetical protein L3J44_06130 [Campylobacteraceae bacterium]|nr:hypothetical protein [Campylobacteraceae bacterium]